MFEMLSVAHCLFTGLIYSSSLVTMALLMSASQPKVSKKTTSIKY